MWAGDMHVPSDAGESAPACPFNENVKYGDERRDGLTRSHRRFDVLMRWWCCLRDCPQDVSDSKTAFFFFPHHS